MLRTDLQVTALFCPCAQMPIDPHKPHAVNALSAKKPNAKSFPIKICGLNTMQAVEAAVTAGADMLGFVFFSKSPRHVGYHQAAELVAFARRIAPKVEIVALSVDATEVELKAIFNSISPDWMQMHGHETPAHVAFVRGQYDVAVMKAIGIRDSADIEEAIRYKIVADRLLLDAKPHAGALLPGGNGIPFDHQLIAEKRFGLPFMLSGGLNVQNIGEAIRLVRPDGIDVSSGVKSAPGVKDAERIHAFVRAAREALDMNRQ